MKSLAKYCIYIAMFSLLLGIISKLLNIDYTSMGISVNYPIHPKTFLEFANTLLLLAIALLLAGRSDSQ